jgi:hypothetical protein
MIFILGSSYNWASGLDRILRCHIDQVWLLGSINNDNQVAPGIKSDLHNDIIRRELIPKRCARLSYLCKFPSGNPLPHMYSRQSNKDNDDNNNTTATKRPHRLLV